MRNNAVNLVNTELDQLEVKKPGDTSRQTRQFLFQARSMHYAL